MGESVLASSRTVLSGVRHSGAGTPVSVTTTSPRFTPSSAWTAPVTNNPVISASEKRARRFLHCGNAYATT